MVSEEQRPSKLLKSIFKEIHPDLMTKYTDEQIDAYLDMAPICIVECPDLKGETKKQRKNRMECHQIYNGDYKQLCNCLRNIYPEKNAMSAYKLMLWVYEGIRPVSEIGEPVEQTKPVEDTTPVIEPTSVEPVTEVVEVVAEATKDDIVLTDEKEQIVTETTVSTPTNEVVEEVKSEPESQSVDIVTNSRFSKMEENKMNDLNERLAAAANKMSGGTSAKQSKVTNEVKAEVVSVLDSSTEARNQWAAENKVQKLIMGNAPAIKRNPAKEGLAVKPVVSKTDASKNKTSKEVAADKYRALITKFTGKVMDIEAFRAASDDVKFANVCPDNSGIAKAKAMVELMDKIYNNPDAKYEAFIPEKFSGSIKGYQVNGVAYPTKELIALVLDKSNAFILGEGSDGKDAKNDVLFYVGKVAKSQKMAIQGSTSKTLAMRGKNRAAFMNPEHVIYLFSEIDKTKKGSTSFAAKIAFTNAEGAVEKCGASVSCYKLENGQRVQSSISKDGTVNYKKVQASIKVSCECDAVVKTADSIGAAFKRDDSSVSAINALWGINLSTEAAKDLLNMEVDSKNNYIFNILCEIRQGGIDTSDIKSSTLKAAEAKAKQSEEDAANVAAEAMAQ